MAKHIFKKPPVVNNWKVSSIALTLMLLLSVSCSDNEGNWDDNIGLSQNTASFESSGDSITISTQYSGWWISDMFINGIFVISLDTIDTISDNFKITTPELTIQRTNAKELKIYMSENKTDEERILKIGMQAGNYFDRITITQEKQ